MINDGKDRNETAWGAQPTTQVADDSFESYNVVNKVVNEERFNDDRTCVDRYTPHIKHSGWFRQVTSILQWG